MSLIRALGALSLQFGLDPRRAASALRGIPHFARDLRRYRRLGGGIPITEYMPILGERFEQAGHLPTHYFHQDLWAARKIFAANPVRHVDVGSSVSGFVSHLLAFRSVEIVDIRPLDESIDGLTVTVGDATHLEIFADNSVESLSSLHAAEHFGLGRYGDPVNPTAHVVFMSSLQRVLKPGGRLYFSVPSGVERVEFNAHRVLRPETVLASFAGLKLLSFSCIKDDRRFYRDCAPSEVASERYGCGLFEFTKE
jgi:SAM-dependent methyltransferase